MKTTSTLMTAAAALAIGLAGAAYAADEAPGAKSDIMLAAETSDAPGGTGVNESAASKATTQKGENEMPDEGAGSMQGGGDLSADQGGTGVKASSDSEGATNKTAANAEDDQGMNEGDSSGNAPGGTGVEDSADGDGATSKSE
ncbi:MAG: hypothetical protein R3D01_11545 [Hyphomicrobiales bacterium]